MDLYGDVCLDILLGNENSDAIQRGINDEVRWIGEADMLANTAAVFVSDTLHGPSSWRVIPWMTGLSMHGIVQVIPHAKPCILTSQAPRIQSTT